MAKILVVDDDRQIRGMMMRILTDEGYEVIEAANGSEAVEKARDALPDLILLDEEMPVLNGFDALKRLRRHEETESIPVVMVTVMAPLRGEQEALSLGVIHYLPKPWTTDIMKATIKVSLREGQSIAGEPADASQKAKGGQPGEQGGDPTALGDSTNQEVPLPTPPPVIATGDKLMAMEQLLGGGIPLGTLTFLEGASGAGKSVLCQHLTVGALHGGHCVAYFSSQHTTESLIAQMASIGLDVSDDLEENKLCIFPVDQPARDEDSEPFLAVLAQHIAGIIGEYNFVIADAITSLAESSDDREIISLFSNCKRLCRAGGTIILVADPYAFHGDTLQRLQAQCDTHISLWAESLGRRQVKTLQVHKINNTHLDADNQVSFDVRPKMGMNIIPISRTKA